MGNEVKELLEKIQNIRTYSKRVDYNIFSAISLKNKETMHSSILASFLNSNARHGLGETFLQLFIEEVGIQSLAFNVSNSRVETEKSAPAEGVNGRIDIYISSEELDETLNSIQKKAIIIENKLDAGDQPQQLVRYSEWACGMNEYEGKMRKDDFVILYLTLKGKKPSENSYVHKDSKTPVKYIPISYQYHILPWLEKCIEKAALAPDVREPLNQYHVYITNLIKQQIMDETIAENILAAEKIKNSYYNGLNIAARKFVDELKKEFQKMNYDVKIESNYEKFLFWSINIKKPEWDKMRIRFQYDSKNFENLYYGIFFILSEDGTVLAKQKDKILEQAEHDIQKIRSVEFLKKAQFREGKNKERWPFKVPCDDEFKNMHAEHVASPDSAFRTFIIERVKTISQFVEEYEKIQ